MSGGAWLLIIAVLSWIVYLYTLVLLARVVFDWVILFSRSWQPRGIVLVIANLVYGLTDPPLRFLARYIPPLQLGRVALDVGFIVLFVVLSLIMSLLGMLA